MKTYSTSAAEVRRTWHVLDAADVPLGRLATRAAALIRGKHKVTFAPHLDTGDFVVVINAEKVALTGRKAEQKTYYHHSQYPSGLKARSLREQAERDPTRIVERAVHGMLPHNRLGDNLRGHLKVYVGPDHPHIAQVNGPAQPALSQPPPTGRRRKKVVSTAARPAAAAAPRTTPAAPAAVSAASTDEILAEAEDAAEADLAEEQVEAAAEAEGGEETSQ
jgi:large subunit ribosomal protein L13